MDYLIHDKNSLLKIRSDRNLKNSIRRIRLDLQDGLDVKSLEKKINRHYFACGCGEGAVAVYIALAVSFILWWKTEIQTGSPIWNIILFVAFAAVFGKVLGILRSKYLLKKYLHQLEKKLE